MSAKDWTITKGVEPPGEGPWFVYTFRHISGIEREMRMDIMAPDAAVTAMIRDMTEGLERMVQDERRRLSDARETVATPQL